MAGFFEIEPEQFGKFGADRAVKFVAELLWAEARRLGLPSTRVHVPTNINVKDGGVDASVDAGDQISASDLIEVGKTRFQVKTGNFRPNDRSHLQKELFGKTQSGKAKQAKPTNLKPGIKECLENGGKYVIIAFGAKMTVAQRNKAVALCSEFFDKCDLTNAKVDAWGQDNLCGLVGPFPSICLRVNGRDGTQVRSHQNWGGDADMNDVDKPLKIGNEQEKFVASIQDAILKRSVGHIRVSGEAGVGKTRLVHVATSHPAIAPNVVYFESPTGFFESDIVHEFLSEDNPLYAVVIVDECNPDRRAELVNNFKYRSERVQVISIYQDVDQATGDIVSLPATPLAEDKVSDIIQTYDIPAREADRWARLCHGYARAAHILGHNLKNNPDDLLAPVAEARAWERWIAGPDQLDSQAVRERTVVLKHIALFRRFGFKEPHAREAKFIATLVEKAEGIRFAKFCEIVNHLRDRKILQGETTLYITPQIAHVWLWVQWWKTYRGSFVLDEILSEMPPSLIGWFQEMFRYAAESEAAIQFVEELLGPEGPFKDGSYLRDSLGSDFFLKLTDASPHAALKCLKRTVATWSDEELLRFEANRQNIIFALERIVVHRELFQEGARILLRLAENENAAWGNNASGVFAELFSPAPATAAPTEAPPKERFPILVETISSSSKAVRALAIRACREALQNGHFSRVTGVEQQGIRPTINLWKPKTWEEFFESYRRVWCLLAERRTSLPPDEEVEAIDVLLTQGRGLLGNPNLSDLVYETICEIGSEGEQNRKKVLKLVTDLLRHDARYNHEKISDEIRSKLESLRERLTGSDFSSRLRRFVAMDISEDLFQERERGEQTTVDEIERLARQCVEDPEKLRGELPWLVTEEAESGHQFGYRLGVLDDNVTLLPMICDAQQNAAKDKASLIFLGAYLGALHQRSIERWEAELDALAASSSRQSWLIELTWRSGMTDRAANRILDLVECESIPAAELRLFSWGRSVAELSESVFARWIDLLLASDDVAAIWVAVDQFETRYRILCKLKNLPEQRVFRIVSDARIFSPMPKATPRSALSDYAWSQLVEAMIVDYPDKGAEILKLALHCIGNDGTIFSSMSDHSYRTLRQIVLHSPDKSWDVVSAVLEAAEPMTRWRVGHWLQGENEAGSDNVWEYLPREKVLAWIDADRDSRLGQVVDSAPKTLRREGIPTLTHRLIREYGADEEIRGSLIGHCMAGGWWGNESDHWAAVMRGLSESRREETHPNILNWIDEFIDVLEQRIQHAKVAEERDSVWD